MPDARPRAEIQALRARIAAITAYGRPANGVLPFGVPAIDAYLPEAGLARGALHEVAGDATTGASAALFVAGIMARSPGQILWCVTRPDLFAPAIAQAGLDPDRVIYVEATDEKTLLACFEEGLRHGSLGGVVAEVARLPMIASRRLQLAAESTGTPGIALHRWHRPVEPANFGQPTAFDQSTAAVTRWRVTPLPSAPLPVAGVGRARWLVELIRNRAGECANFMVEACDETGHLALFADLADGSLAPPAWGHRATG